jgi:exosortase
VIANDQGSALDSASPQSPAQMPVQSVNTAIVGIKAFISAILAWPLATKLAVLGLISLYGPVIREGAHAWLTNDDYAHGVYILPVSAFLVWMRRQEIREAKMDPTAWGFVPLVFGLIAQSAGYLLSVGFLAIVSLVPVTAGAVLLLHGKNLWRITAFAICFLAFASTFPGSLIARPSQWLQARSTEGAYETAKVVGYTVMRHGNIIEIPGEQLEVAEVCSGFKKLLALLAFASLYGYMFQIGIAKRLLLFIAAIPIALIANTIRITGLIAVASAAGDAGLKIAHDWAELSVLVLAFGLFVLFGKLIGCRTLRFIQ